MSTKQTKIAFIRGFLHDSKPCNMNDFLTVYKGVAMDVYLQKVLKRWKRSDVMLTTLFQDFPILHEFATKASSEEKYCNKNPEILYVGFQEEALREEVELHQQIKSLQKAIQYATKRLARPDKIHLDLGGL